MNFWEKLWHFHIWDYITYLHRKCVVCFRCEKCTRRKFFTVASPSKFENMWTKYKGSVAEFEKEAQDFKAKLNKCLIHSKLEQEKIRWGIWQIYNECAIRQNRGFPYYGIVDVKI